MFSRFNNWYRDFSNFDHPEGPGFLYCCPVCKAEPYPTNEPCRSCDFQRPWHEPPRFFSKENLIPLVVLGAFIVLILAVVANVIFGFAPHF